MTSFDFLLPDEAFSTQLEHTIIPALAPYRETFYFDGHGGARLYGEFFRNPNAKSTIVLCHGFCEYIGKYAEIIYNFVSLGYSVAICEHRGHGFSDRQTENPTKVHIDSFDTYTADFNYFTALVKDAFKGQSLILYGHSMGGCIATRYLEQFPGHYSGAILSCPMLEIRPSGLSAKIALPYARVLLRRGAADDTNSEAVFDPTPDFEHSSCTNKERYDAYFAQRIAEPRYQTSHGTVGWLVTSLEAIEEAITHADCISIPVLLCQAGRDTLVYPAGHARLVAQLKGAALCTFPRAKHEITSADAATRADFWKTVATFLKKNAV